MSPALWSALQAPSHFASMVEVVSRGAPLGPVAARGRFHSVGRIEVAGDFGMRGDRHAGDAADGIADIAGRGLLDVLLGAHLLAHRRERRAHLLVGSLVGAMLHRHLGHRRPRLHDLHFPQAGLAHRQIHRTGIRCRSERQQANRRTTRNCRVMSTLPGFFLSARTIRLSKASAAAARRRRKVPSGRRTRYSRPDRAARRGISPPCRTRRSGRPRADAHPSWTPANRQ